jgi:hypothetical protein
MTFSHMPQKAEHIAGKVKRYEQPNPKPLTAVAGVITYISQHRFWTSPRCEKGLAAPIPDGGGFSQNEWPGASLPLHFCFLRFGERVHLAPKRDWLCRSLMGGLSQNE